MQNSPESIVLPQLELDAKLLQLDSFFIQECGEARRCPISLKASYEEPGSDQEYWWYLRPDKTPLAIWSCDGTTKIKQARLVIDESGRKYLPGTMRFSRLSGEV